MRKVTYTRNDTVLRKLGDDFVEPLLRVLVNAKVESLQVRTAQAYSGLSPEHTAALKRIFAIEVGTGKNRKTFGVACNSVVRGSTLLELSALPALYRSQVAAVRTGNYSLRLTAVPSAITKLFKDKIYGELFDRQELWDALGMAAFDRSLFHDNFMEENGHPSTCPYCDIDSINSKGSRVVEHFLPKSKFPLLAVEASNLFSACSGCNGSAGKLATVLAKVTCPYVKEIGLFVDFDFDDPMEKVGIAAMPGNDDVAGYLTLLKLQDRYAGKTVWHRFKDRRESISESLLMFQTPGRDELLAYVMRLQKGGVLNYAVRYWADSVMIPALTASSSVP